MFLVAAGGFVNINGETTTSSLFPGMVCGVKIGAVASGDMVVVGISTVEDKDEIENIMRVKV